MAISSPKHTNIHSMLTDTTTWLLMRTEGSRFQDAGVDRRCQWGSADWMS
jgi:hypothetical protein